jgi:peptide deformylase
MAVLPIVKYPDPRLRQETTAVTAVTDEIRKLCADLADTMFAANGAGIAAIQVGAKERIFLVDAAVAGGREEDPPLAFINPELVSLSAETEVADEGCLSFPTIYVPVKRSLKARIRALGLDGQPFEMEREGLCARAFQHEADHLNGRLLADFVGPLRREMIKRKLKRVAEEGDEAEDAGEGKKARSAR